MPQKECITPKNGEVLAEQTDTLDRHHTVGLSNDLVRAVHQINADGKLLLAIVISRLDSQAQYKLEDTKTTVTVAQWEDLHKGKNPWRDLKRAANNVFEAEIRMDTSTATKQRYKRIRWCSSIEYCENEAKVVVILSRELLPHVTQLNAKFTSFKIGHLGEMRTLYAWRLYELLMQWKSTGMVEIKIETLHECLEVPNSCSVNFGEMRRRVIVPAVKEIEEKANLEIMWNPKKKGRRVASILFGFTERKQHALF